MENKDTSKKHFMLSIFKSIFRLGASYGLWMTGDQMLMAVGVFFGIAEILGILEEL
jgi:hypothetical protein|tara:strand:- start:2622 stop:2789 length:168 start_codon:yes stop_codon:yes gene_type:complete